MDFVPHHKQNEQHSSVRPTAPHGLKRGQKIARIIMSAIAVLLLGIGGWGAYTYLKNINSQGVDKNGYQAVFLTNGQVYFGKLQSTKGDYLTLTNIYYLQVQQTVQPADANAAVNQGETQLVKLGNELHGPQDSMRISDKQVLFWENLKADSKVSQAISNYKAEK
jgi:hypothetical protein